MGMEVLTSAAFAELRFHQIRTILVALHLSLPDLTTSQGTFAYSELNVKSLLSLSIGLKCIHQGGRRDIILVLGGFFWRGGAAFIGLGLFWCHWKGQAERNTSSHTSKHIGSILFSIILQSICLLNYHLII